MLVVKEVREYDNTWRGFANLFDNSWSGAKDTLEDIISAEKEEEFMEYLDMVFEGYEEIDCVMLNDFIWHDRAIIYKDLGLDENGKLIEEDNDTHNCKYCGQLVEGSYEDLLCGDCRESFGHSLYSEL